MQALPASVFRQAYSILDLETPLGSDCGLLCGAACCQDPSSALGMYLLPGEEKLLAGQDWLVMEKQDVEEFDFPPSWEGHVYFARCLTPCPRHLRPLQCRTYPLAPHLHAGHLWLIWETLDLPYTCPLSSGSRPLRQDFILAVEKAWRLLLAYPAIRELVNYDSSVRKAAGMVIDIVKTARL